MPAHAEKLSISVPADLARTVRKRVGARGLSRFVTRAIQHELEREQLGAYLDELTEQHGPLPEALVAETRAAWHER